MNVAKKTALSWLTRLALALVSLVIITSCGESSVNNHDGENNDSSLTQNEIDQWVDNQDVIVVPWAEKLDASVMEDAVIDVDRITIPRQGHDELLYIFPNDIIYAENYEIPDWNILRRVTKTAHTEQEFVFLTRQAGLDELYLKHDVSSDRREQNLDLPAHIYLSFDVVICKNESGVFEVCNIGGKTDKEKDDSASFAQENSLTFSPRLDLRLNKIKTQGYLRAPGSDACNCLTFAMNHGGGTRSEEKLKIIDSKCGPKGTNVSDDRLHWETGLPAFLDGQIPPILENGHAYAIDVLKVQAYCRSEVERWKFLLEGSASISLPYSFSFSAAYSKPDTPLSGEFKLPGKLAFPSPIGPVTLSASIQLTYSFSVGGEVSVGFPAESAPTLTWDVDFGVELDGDRLVKADNTNKNANGISFDGGSPDLAGKVSASATFNVKGNLKSKIFDAAGPIFTIAPYVTGTLEASASTSQAPTCTRNVSGGVKAEISAEAGIPFTSLNARLEPQTIFDTCETDEGSLLREKLCFSDPKDLGFCTSATPPKPWAVRLKAYKPNIPQGVGEDPDGVDIQKIYLLRDGQAYPPTQMWLNGNLWNGHPGSLLGPDSDDLTCDGTIRPDWEGHGISFTDSLIVRFNREIKANDHIVIEHTFQGAKCKSGGTAAIQVGDKDKNEWGPPITSANWSDSQLAVRVVQDGCHQPNGSAIWDYTDNKVCIQPQVY